MHFAVDAKSIEVDRPATKFVGSANSTQKLTELSSSRHSHFAHPHHVEAVRTLKPWRWKAERAAAERMKFKNATASGLFDSFVSAIG
jgi:hypothetical protein